MSERQESIRRQFEESEQAKAAAEAAEREFREQLSEARHEAARIREDAREQGAAIIAEMREQAQAEANRIIAAAHAQLDADRQRVLTELRAEVGDLAVEPRRADRGGVARRRQAPAAHGRALHRRPGVPGPDGVGRVRGLRGVRGRAQHLRGPLMRGASTRAAGAVVERVEQAVESGADAIRPGRASCSRCCVVLDAEPTLRRVLTDPTVEADRKAELAESLLSDFDARHGGRRQRRRAASLVAAARPRRRRSSRAASTPSSRRPRPTATSTSSTTSCSASRASPRATPSCATRSTTARHRSWPASGWSRP